MKQTIYLMLLIGFFSISGKIGAQEAYRDVLTLTNGSIIKGVVTEVEAPGSIGIKTSDGSLFIFKNEEVESIKKEIIDLTPPLQSQGNKFTSHYQDKKNPGLAFLFSFLLPGGGQYYNGQYVKGGIMTGLAVTSYSMICAGVLRYESIFDDTNDALIVVGTLIGLGNALWSMIDAPIVSNRINKLTNIRLGKNMNLHIRPDYSFNREPAGGNATFSPSIGMKLSLTLK